MKTILMTCLIAGAGLHVCAQKLELFVSGNTGLFSFTGNSATRTTQLNYVTGFPDTFDFGYFTANRYGSGSGSANGLSLSFQRISKKNSILGIQAGYERNQSPLDIHTVNTFVSWDPHSGTHEEATGKTNPGYNAINFSPYLGQRFESKLLTYDVNALVEFVHILGTYQKAKAVDASGDLHSFSYSSSTAPSGFKNSNPIVQDVRLGVRLTTYYKKIGITLGYSLGVANYTYNEGYENHVATSRIARFGITYKLLASRKK